MERGGWIRGADGQEKGDGDGQKASGIGCRGDEKRMPNQSRPFKLAGPFPPAPLPLPLEMEGPAEAQSGFRNLNEWPALGALRIQFLGFASVGQSAAGSHQTSTPRDRIRECRVWTETLAIKWADLCPYRQIWTWLLGCAVAVQRRA